MVARPCDLVVLLDNKVTWLFYNLFYYIFLLFFIDIWGDNSSMCVLYGFYLRVITSLYIVMYPWLLHVHVSLLSTIYICKQTLMYHWRRSYDRKFWFLPLYYFTPESNFVFILIYSLLVWETYIYIYINTYQTQTTMKKYIHKCVHI